MSILKEAAYSVIRYLQTPPGKEIYEKARKQLPRFGALCVVTRKATPYDEIEAISEIAAEVMAYDVLG